LPNGNVISGLLEAAIQGAASVPNSDILLFSDSRHVYHYNVRDNSYSSILDLSEVQVVDLAGNSDPVYLSRNIAVLAP
jgi:hypothetical protein